MAEAVFVLGAIKTGTSSLVGAMNTHPDVFILYEANLFSAELSSRGREFLGREPSARPFFGPQTDVHYEGLADHLRAKGYDYRVIGDKIPGLSLDLLAACEQHRIVYAVRDLRTWLVKRQVRELYATDENLVPAAVLYTTHFLRSRLAPFVLHLPMEDFVTNNASAVARIADFIECPGLRESAVDWWDSYRYSEGDPKSYIDWWGPHASSRTRPAVLDTHVDITERGVLTEILGLFDAHYRALDQPADRAQIERDLGKLRQLAHEHQPLADAYQSVTTTSLNRSKATARVGRRIRRLMACV